MHFRRLCQIARSSWNDGRGSKADPGADGTIDETRQFYYTQEWQVIEEQVGATVSTARPDVQYVWGTQYVDDLVVRYRDADASGSSGSPSLEEELYSLADANFNVTWTRFALPSTTRLPRRGEQENRGVVNKCVATRLRIAGRWPRRR